MTQRTSELLANQAQQTFVGRDAELDALRAVLSEEGPPGLGIG